MRRPLVRDKKLLLVLAILLLFIIVITAIWQYYNMELRAIEQQKKELKLEIEKLWTYSLPALTTYSTP